MHHIRDRVVLGAVVATLATAAMAQTVGPFNVPGTSSPFLAGMPNGSTCCVTDSAPGQSPVLVTGLTLSAGASLTFVASGSVDNAGGTPTLSPDGGSSFSNSAENGIAGESNMPANALIGVFLDASQPDSSAAPSSLDSSNTTFTSLSPGLKQPFFIGDGLTGTGSGSQQTFVVPSGATRLFLASADGFEWSNNTGSFSVSVTQGTTGTVTPTATDSPQPTATATATRTVTVTPTNSPVVRAPAGAPAIPTLSTGALIGLALLLGTLAVAYSSRRR